MRLPADDGGRSKKRLEEGSDAELNLVYYLFRAHHWTPEMYYAMGHGGRDLALALALREVEQLTEG